jgi:hypothetical protein
MPAVLSQDVEAPQFVNGCPEDIDVFAARLGETTFVNWTDPVVTDNSGDVIQLSCDATPGSDFAGTTTVTYTAVDPSNNTATCEMTVTVTGKGSTQPCALNV